MIEVERLHKTFGSHVALAGLSFVVGAGSVVGLLGRNGAGKSTCLRILAGVLRPTSGTVKLEGRSTDDEPERTRESVGYLPESAPLYPELRVTEYLRFRAELKGVPRKQRSARIEEVLHLVHAEALRHVRCDQLSRGYQKRVSLAETLLTDPPILLLDEPTAGLDPSQNRETRRLIATLGETRTIIVSTHILAEVEAMCRDALVIDEGRIVASGSLQELLKERDNCELMLVVRGDPDAVTALTAGLPDLRSCTLLEPNLFQLRFAGASPEQLETFAESFAGKLVAAGLYLREMRQQSRNLEQVWTHLVDSHQPDSDAP